MLCLLFAAWHSCRGQPGHPECPAKPAASPAFSLGASAALFTACFFKRGARVWS